jgi:hypothetical protein
MGNMMMMMRWVAWITSIIEDQTHDCGSNGMTWANEYPLADQARA